jgi:hypothetical protein
MAALTPVARGQTSVTLAWDPSRGDGIAGYRLFQGEASREYSSVIDVGNTTTNTVSNLVRGVTYFFAVTAYATNGLQSDFSSEVSYTVPRPPDIIVTNDSRLTFAADSGTISPPFVVGNGTISQPSQTGLENGGRAVYRFNLPRAGSYIISAMVTAPNDGQNSFCVNIDAEPSDPLMIWDIPVCATPTRHLISWRGKGNGDPGLSEYRPKIFNLSAGTHQLVIRGREVNTTLGAISIVAAPPKLQIQTVFSDLVIVSGAGQPGQTYNLLRSHDLKSWSPIGAVTLDSSGYFEFWDFTATLPPVSMYRLQGQ